MKGKFFSTIIICCLISILFSSCKKKEQILFDPIGSIDASIKDIVPMDNDGEFLVLASTKESKKEYSHIYHCTKSQTGIKAKHQCRSQIIYHDLCYSDGIVWLCGEDMNIRMSADTGKTLEKKYEFSNWRKNWPSDISDLKQISIKNGKPFYFIGTKEKDLLKGNFYYYAYSDTVFISSQKSFGLNDMVMYNDDAYVAGYGSIIHVSNNGESQELEKVGGENFTSICLNDKYIYASTYSGAVFRSEIGENNWEKMTSLGSKLLHIETNNLGDVIATGESKNILISTDNGDTWREEKWKEGNKISCLVTINDKFYIGTEKGTIIRISHENLATDKD